MNIRLGLGRKRCCDDFVQIVALGNVETCPTCSTSSSMVSNAQASADGEELGAWLQRNAAGCYVDGLRKGLK